VCFSPDNRYALSGSCDSTIKLWDIQNGNLLKSFTGHTGFVTSVCFSPDGQSVLSGSFDSTLRLWDVQSGKEIKSITRHAGKIVAVSLSPDSHYAMSSSYDGTFKLWDVQSGKEIRSFDGQYTYLRFFPVSPNGKFIITVLWNNTMKLWDIQSGENIQSFKGHTDIVYCVCFSHDGKYLLSGSLDQTMKLWDVQSGKEIKSFNGHIASVQSVCFSSDDRYALSGSYDNTMKLWDIQSGKELATLISIDSTDWAVVTTEGLFDASPGAMKLMYFVSGMEVIELDQLKERYYEPGLLSKLLGYNKEPLRHSEIFDKVKLYPEITTEQVSDGKSLKVHLKNRGGGIGKVIVSINGKEITADARGPQQNPDADSITLSIDIINHPYLIPGKENNIEIKAKNGEGSIVSRGVNVIYTPPIKGNIDTTMRVFILCSGISDYNGADIDLRYAAKDAREMADALQTGAKRLFGSDKTYTWLLTTDNKETNKKPTRKNIVNAFDEISLQAHPNDILVIYLSGHGINWGGQDGDFYYLTQDAFSANPDAYNDSEIRKSSAISSNELVELIKKVNVTKQVLIIDACASGRMVENLLAKKEISSSTIRALTFMQNRTASYIIAGCTSDQSSYEASRYGQGVLTYSLLEGIKGAALDEGKLVEVNSLFRHANLRVPDLAKGIGGIQEPRIISPPERKPFYIGQMNETDKQNIHLSEPKPLFLMTNFQDEEMMKDVLGLGKIVDEALRDISFRGTEAPLIFLDTRDFPDAYSLSGRYSVSGNEITLKVNLFKGSEKKQTLTFTREKDKLETFGNEILNKISALISK